MEPAKRAGTKKFTKAECRELARLMRKVIANGCYWPDETTFKLSGGVESKWAPELVMLRVNEKTRRFEILLAIYDGGIKSLRGFWHIPGGYNRIPEPDIQTTCSRIALREIGMDVSCRGVISAYKWLPGEHPDGRPLSLYIRVEPKVGGLSSIKTSKKLKFFPTNKLPRKMVGPHRNFIARYIPS